MKRLLITSLLLLAILNTQAQSPSKVVEQDLDKAKVELDSLKPLITVELEGERFLVDYVDSQVFLDVISPKSISAFNVLKGDAATSLYGKRANNGVIMLTLSNNSENRKLFEQIQNGDFQSYSNLKDIKNEVDEKTSFSLTPSRSINNGQVSIEGKEALSLNKSDQIIFVQIGSEKIKVSDIRYLDNLDKKLIRSIDVLRHDQYEASNTTDDKDQVIVTLIKNGKAKRFMKKLERIQKKK